MINIVDYRAEWPAEFAGIGGSLRRALGGLALRIDHIGSTSVPGLAAKDIIDIQITVQDLDPRIEELLKAAGFNRLAGTWQDHVPPGAPDTGEEWGKWLFRPAEGQRLANIHVRRLGRLNQRYPLLFRDYLRTHSSMAEAYAQVKRSLARYYSENIEAYYDVKDPVCDIIMGGAEAWAGATHWQPGPSDC